MSKNQMPHDQCQESPSPPHEHTHEHTAKNDPKTEADGSNSPSSSIDSSEYIRVDSEELTENNTIQPTPSYHFPHTWSKAKQDASTALTSLTTATITFGQAVATSGIAEASWSISGALAATANRGALVAADYAVRKAGADKDALPGVVRNWLRAKERRDEAGRRWEGGRRRVPERWEGDSGEVGSAPFLNASRMSLAELPGFDDWEIGRGEVEGVGRPVGKEEGSPYGGGGDMFEEVEVRGGQEVVGGDGDEDEKEGEGEVKEEEEKEEGEEEMVLAGLVGKE
ncbi:hypothetical protein P280DRAFT_514405 [Massarina eburnea CBS 473.64]|uniref:Uncharacterized protein n=1 Tax=Massarina eburnea CBS 473.64 TaxID=1395130 RepID=A0A6A6SFC7_9PLEO|nr:hypothetical protein P280DRAFT_514405 [Massarina eburnea CBS 473.64]